MSDRCVVSALGFAVFLSVGCGGGAGNELAPPASPAKQNATLSASVTDSPPPSDASRSTGAESAKTDAPADAKTPNAHDGVPHARPSKPQVLVGTGAVVVNGPLPPESVERVVRARLGTLRACYEQALGKYGTPFDGRVTVKFVVDASGTSTMIEDGGSDIPAGEMVPCVLAQFEKLSFPKPVGKVATVVYPVVFKASR